MRFDNLPGSRQTEARSSNAFGRIKRFEDIIYVINADPRTIIYDVYNDEPVIGFCGSQSDRPAVFIYRLIGIDEKIDEHLLQLGHIPPAYRVGLLKRRFNFNIRFFMNRPYKSDYIFQ